MMKQEEIGRAAMNLKVSSHWNFRDFKISFPLNPGQRANMSIFSIEQQKKINILCFRNIKMLCFDSFRVL